MKAWKLRNILTMFLVAVWLNAIAVPASAKTFPTSAKTLVVHLNGDGVFIPPEDVPMPELLDGLDVTACFEVGMFNLATKRRMGTGVACIADVDLDEQTGAVSLTDTVFFIFQDGLIASQDRIEVRPAGVGVGGQPSGVGQNKTHITGGFPDEDNIVGGTGIYKNVVGKVRLSGASNMSGMSNPVPELELDCIFVIDFEPDPIDSPPPPPPPAPY